MPPGGSFQRHIEKEKKLKSRKGLMQTGLMQVRGLVSKMHLLMGHYCSIFSKCHYLYEFYACWSQRVLRTQGYKTKDIDYAKQMPSCHREGTSPPSGAPRQHPGRGNAGSSRNTVCGDHRLSFNCDCTNVIDHDGRGENYG